jgi:hypothetical protein
MGVVLLLPLAVQLLLHPETGIAKLPFTSVVVLANKVGADPYPVVPASHSCIVEPVIDADPSATCPLGPVVIVRLSVVEPISPAESVTFTVNDAAISVVFGVPLITPALDRLSPTAESPLPDVTLHVYPAPLPPTAVSVVEYAVPSTPFGTLLVVTESVG